MQFAVRHAGLSLKITLDEKWQSKPLTTSVVMPFVKSFNKKRPDYDAVQEEGLVGVQIDGEAWIDPSQSAKAVLPPDVKALDLHFDSKEALATARACRVSCGETDLRIELNTKWLRQHFAAAVVAPFAAAYNKKHGNPLVPTPIDVASLCAIAIDDAPVALEDAAKPTCLVVPSGAKRIELAFGSLPTAASASAGSGGAPGVSGLTDRERLKQLWSKVRYTPETCATARELKWSNFRLTDGMAIGHALLAAAAVQCEGAYGASLNHLLTLDLSCVP